MDIIFISSTLAEYIKRLVLFGLCYLIITIIFIFIGMHKSKDLKQTFLKLIRDKTYLSWVSTIVIFAFFSFEFGILVWVVSFFPIYFIKKTYCFNIKNYMDTAILIPVFDLFGLMYFNQIDGAFKIIMLYLYASIIWYFVAKMIWHICINSVSTFPYGSAIGTMIMVIIITIVYYVVVSCVVLT